MGLLELVRGLETSIPNPSQDTLSLLSEIYRRLNSKLHDAAPLLLMACRETAEHAKLVKVKDGGKDADDSDPTAVFGKWRAESSPDGWITYVHEAIRQAEEL